MKETPFFFEGDTGSLFGLLHEPDPATPAREAFVFCHPFGEEKLWTHRTYVSMARRLAERGHPVLRFDFLGNGDSDGAFADSRSPAPWPTSPAPSIWCAPAPAATASRSSACASARPSPR